LLEFRGLAQTLLFSVCDLPKAPFAKGCEGMPRLHPSSLQEIADSKRRSLRQPPFQNLLNRGLDGARRRLQAQRIAEHEGGGGDGREGIGPITPGDIRRRAVDGFVQGVLLTQAPRRQKQVARTAGSTVRVSSMLGVIPRRRISLVNEQPQTANPTVCATGGAPCYVPNPVRAGLVSRPEDWRRSSYSEYAGVSADQQNGRCGSIVDRVRMPSGPHRGV
jgi:hypothetical protein